MTRRNHLARLTTAIAIGWCALLVLHATAASVAAQTPSKTTVTIRPLLVQAPIFGADIDLPRLPSAPSNPSGGDDGSAASGSTDAALNAAYMAGIEIQSRRWFVEGSGMWAALSADRTTPLVNVKTDAYTFNARGGVRLFAGFAVTGGLRYLHLDLDASLGLPQAGRTLEGHAKPALWDPLVGLDWRGTVGDNRVAIDIYAQGGGFGVGADVDASGGATIDWRIAGPFQIRVGYTLLHYKLTVADVNVGSFNRTLVSRQTLHGPVVGFGFVF